MIILSYLKVHGTLVTTYNMGLSLLVIGATYITLGRKIIRRVVSPVTNS